MNNNEIFGKLSSCHEKMIEIFERLKKISPTNATVLILGESGTGKELTARAIHDNSKRSHKDFMPFNCASGNRELIDSELFGHAKGSFTGAINDHKGKFEAANGGTLFLDEIGDMPLQTQAKILRALEAKEINPVGSNKILKIDVRVISATNKKLREEVTKGNFREDLFYRLCEIDVELPPLRERENDIPFLFDEFVNEFNIEFKKNITGIKIAALAILQTYNWPGNIREFRNVLKKTIMLMNDDKTEIFTEDLIKSMNFTKNISSKSECIITNNAENRCPRHNSNYSLARLFEECEKDYIINVLENTNGNKTKAAKILNIDRITLYKKIKKLNIKGKINWQ